MFFPAVLKFHFAQPTRAEKLNWIALCVHEFAIFSHQIIDLKRKYFILIGWSVWFSYILLQ